MVKKFHGLHPLLGIRIKTFLDWMASVLIYGNIDKEHYNIIKNISLKNFAIRV